MLNIYKLSQEDNNDYDTYSDLIVAAPSEDIARMIHPDESRHRTDEEKWSYKYSTWASSPDKVKVEFIGTTEIIKETGIILGSFHAG